jgi:hypothetical protein
MPAEREDREKNMLGTLGVDKLRRPMNGECTANIAGTMPGKYLPDARPASTVHQVDRH